MKPKVLELKNLSDWSHINVCFYDHSKHKKAKGVNRNVITTISHNKYKHVLLNNKCLEHSMNIILSKDHRIGTYQINKISLPCFHNKIYIQNNGHHGIALGYLS